MKRPRRTPYTARGIHRVKCSFLGCRRRGYATWQVCADQRVYRALCWIHDIALNRLVLEWVGDKQAERKIAKYSAGVIRRMHAGT